MGTWRCGYCDSYNPDTVDRCITCGRSQAGDEDVVDGRPREETVACPACQGANPPGRSRCQWCGAELPVDALPNLLASQRGQEAEEFGPVGSSGDLPSDLLEDEAEPTIQTRPKPKTRPCARCGISLEPDEWVLVAGPRILCRACFHEEFGRGREPSDVKRDSGPSAVGPTEMSAPEAQGLQPAPSAASGKGSRAALWYGLSAAGLLCVGGVLTWIAGWSWGATPLAAAGLLAALAWRAGRRPETVRRDA